MRSAAYLYHHNGIRPDFEKEEEAQIRKRRKYGELFDFSGSEATEEEKAANTGEDPGSEKLRMKRRRISHEKWLFLLKKYETSHPLVHSRYANQTGYGPRFAFDNHKCGPLCRDGLIKVGDAYICRWSGLVHACSPYGCEHSLGRSACTVTGEPVDLAMRHTYESTASLRRNADYGDDTMEFDCVSDGDADENEENEAPESPKPFATDDGDCGGDEETKPPTQQRLSKEARESTAKDIGLLQSSADAAVRAVLPMNLIETVGLRWLVDEHILYLWKMVILTNHYKTKSLSYKFAHHVRVVLDAMIDGFDVKGHCIVPKVEAIHKAMLDKSISIDTNASAIKFFKQVLKEVVLSDPRGEQLKEIAARG